MRFFTPPLEEPLSTLALKFEQGLIFFTQIQGVHMIKNIASFCVILSCIFACEKVCSTEIHPFFLQRQDGTILEGYFSPPDTSSSPIIYAIQGSSCESALKWHMDLCEQAESLGLGLVVLEKQGISKDDINLFEYNQTNCLQNRLEDYALCLKNINVISPGWEGKVIFWGESEGGLMAANLAAQTSETAAVLLFATGGGMKPREEVKLTIQRRLEEHGALQDEIDQYMSFLNTQMDDMILDPTPDKQFLGNTYKWWASLLTMDKALISLNQRALPIYLVHGIEDNEVPILSADLAAEALAETNALTYLRLEGRGHDLNHTNIQSAACHWLKSILLGQESLGSSLIATRTQLSIPLEWTLNHSSDQQKSSMLIAGKFQRDSFKILLARSNRNGNDDRQAGGGWEAGIDIRYGGKDGSQVDGYVKGEAHDDKGNYVEGKVDHNFNNNEGSVGVHGGNQDEDNK